jgi:hypothetical protein
MASMNPGNARWTILAVLSLPAYVCAQAGPPMATDDLSNPGDEHLEINFAALLLYIGLQLQR